MASDNAAELADVMTSLTAIIEEETGKLLSPGRHSDMREMADAKARLVASLESRNARLARERPNWMAELDGEDHASLTACVRALSEASILNARVLQRQIELSTEMMAAVAAEAQRLTGTRGATYGERGTLFRTDQATPISLNAKL